MMQDAATQKCVIIHDWRGGVHDCADSGDRRSNHRRDGAGLHRVAQTVGIIAPVSDEHRRLGAIGNIPPAETGARRYAQTEDVARAA